MGTVTLLDGGPGTGVIRRPGFHNTTGPLWAGTAAMLFPPTPAEFIYKLGLVISLIRTAGPVIWQWHTKRVAGIGECTRAVSMVATPPAALQPPSDNRYLCLLPSLSFTHTNTMVPLFFLQAFLRLLIVLSHTNSRAFPFFPLRSQICSSAGVGCSYFRFCDLLRCVCSVPAHM